LTTDDVAKLYDMAQGCYRDARYEEAARLYEAVARHQGVDEQLRLRAHLRLAGLLVQQRRTTEALEWLHRAASHGYAPAMYYLGAAHGATGWAERDRNRAFEYYRKAADKGHLLAQRQIAMGWLKGDAGVSRIPLGVMMLVRTFWRAWMLLAFRPDDERIAH
jgi:TPR repeat protein